MIDVIAYIAMVTILAAYFHPNRRMFDYANVLCFIPLLVAAMNKGAVPAALLNLCFGLIAIYNLRRKPM